MTFVVQAPLHKTMYFVVQTLCANRDFNFCPWAWARRATIAIEDSRLINSRIDRHVFPSYAASVDIDMLPRNWGSRGRQLKGHIGRSILHCRNKIKDHQTRCRRASRSWSRHHPLISGATFLSRVSDEGTKVKLSNSYVSLTLAMPSCGEMTGGSVNTAHHAASNSDSCSISRVVPSRLRVKGRTSSRSVSPVFIQTEA